MHNEANEQMGSIGECVELADIGFRSIHAKQYGAEIDVPEENPIFQLDVTIPKTKPTGESERPYGFTIALAVEIHMPDGILRVEPYATYSVKSGEHVELSPDTVTEFANESAIPDLLPFAREALSDIAGRVLRTQIVMPIFKKGDIQFPAPTPQELAELGWLENSES